MSDDPSDEEQRSFTSWKMTMLEAMSCDPEVSDIDYRVAFRIMQHVNRKSREAWASIDRIAAQIGVSRATVMRSMKRLRNTWLISTRSSRTAAAHHKFSELRLNTVLDQKLIREERAKETIALRKQERHEVAKLQCQKLFEVANGELVEVANGDSFEVAQVQPEHLSTEPPEDNTLKNLCSEEEIRRAANE